jgi:histidyl-tRNA synthetase
MECFRAPRVLKGFRDFLPAAESRRRALLARFETVFRVGGFAPIDTPALELAEILLGKGGGETEKQVYRWTDNGGRDVALRFDLTVPFARFAAEHRAELPLPFKRYHIGKVWRGENTQKGRYREFIQCDFDSIGCSAASYDAEIIMTAQSALKSAGVGGLVIRVNHRGLFNRFLDRLGLVEKRVEILRTVDKRGKIGEDGVKTALSGLCGDEKAARLLEYISLSGDWDATLDRLTALSGGPSADSERLAEIARFLRDADAFSAVRLDPSITRGLDYYTGVVFETTLDALPSIGSVCSGGRYDNLTALYSKDEMPGVGASIGLDRLIAALETLEQLPEAAPYACCAVVCVNEAHFGLYEKIAGCFRAAGISCEVYGEAKKKAAQFIYAEKKNARSVIIPSEENPLENPLTVRHLAARKDRTGLSINEAISLIQGECSDR